MICRILYSIKMFSLLALLLSPLSVGAQYDKYYSNLPVEVAKAEVAAVPQRSVCVTDYGAVGDGITLNTLSIQTAIDELAAKGGGHVVVPQGIWLVTSLRLRSNIDLHIEANAVICQTPDKSLYQLDEKGKRFQPCIYAEGEHDICVTGEGTVEGFGKYWRPVKRAKMSDMEWDQYLDMGGTIENNGKLWMPYGLNGYANVTESSLSEEALRADMFRPTNCNRVLVKGITFQNSPRFTVHPCLCKNVIVDGVSARSPWNVQNADGIDLSNCQKCLVVNCYVDCGDDGLCLKSGTGAEGRKNGPCSDIVIQDCRVVHAHGGFAMGSDVAGGMERIVVRNCTFSNTDVGLRFKTAVGRGGTTSNVFISDITMVDIANEAIFFDCGYTDNRFSADVAEKAGASSYQTIPEYAPDYQNIIIDRVICREAKNAIRVRGIAGIPCVHDIEVKNSSFFYRMKDVDIANSDDPVRLTNVKMSTFDRHRASSLQKEMETKRYVPTGDDQYQLLINPIPIRLFRVNKADQVGIDGTESYTCIKIKSHKEPSLSIIYGIYLNNYHPGRLIINGEKIDNIGDALHDGYIYYNLTPYGNDLYIAEVQPNFPASVFVYQ